MSNYFQTLKRLEQEQQVRRANPQQPLTRIEQSEAEETQETPVQTIPVAPTPEAPEPVEPPTELTAPPQELAVPAAATMAADVRPLRTIEPSHAPMVERTLGSYTALFDNLRAIGNGAPVGSVVLCGASSVETIDRISNGLADEVCRHSLRVLVAELYRTVSQPTLKIRLQSKDDSPSEVDPEIPLPDQSITLDLRGGPVPEKLTNWMNSARAHFDMVIIEAPPLAHSVDAAMLARACDGLILAVHARGTSKDALADAVTKADTVGSPVLGVVMQGRPEWTPLWLRRLTAMRSLF